MHSHLLSILFFFFNDTATTEIYTLSLHDALPISTWRRRLAPVLHLHQTRRIALRFDQAQRDLRQAAGEERDRKSTRLNSSHANISYAVFCLKKKKTQSPWRTTPETGPITVGALGN